MCLFPFEVKKTSGEYVSVPCGRCYGCKLEYKSGLEFLCECEKQHAYDSGFGCSFLTLTYNDNSVPVSVSDDDKVRFTLRKKDFQNYNKRLRIKLQRSGYPISQYRFIACGEYGDSFDRPHYHQVVFGLSGPELNSFIPDVWKHGFTSVADLKPGGIRYIIDYLTKSKLPTDLRAVVYESLNIEPPFLLRSHYLGFDYIDKHIPDDSVFYKGKLLPRVVRNYLGISYADYCRDMLKQAHREGYSNVHDYENYLRECFIKSSYALLRQRNIPVDKREFFTLSLAHY